jgi:hypothetical protein
LRHAISAASALQTEQSSEVTRLKVSTQGIVYHPIQQLGFDAGAPAVKAALVGVAASLERTRQDAGHERWMVELMLLTDSCSNEVA